MNGVRMPETPFEISTLDHKPYGRFYDVHGTCHGDRRAVGPYETSEGPGYDKLLQNALVPTESVDTLAAITRVITGDVDAGHGDRIAMVCVDPIFAVHLVANGQLTTDHAQRAIVHADYIEFPKFEVDDRKLILRVYKAPAHQLYTADATGTII